MWCLRLVNVIGHVPLAANQWAQPFAYRDLRIILSCDWWRVKRENFVLFKLLCRLQRRHFDSSKAGCRMSFISGILDKFKAHSAAKCESKQRWAMSISPVFANMFHFFLSLSFRFCRKVSICVVFVIKNTRTLCSTEIADFFSSSFKGGCVYTTGNRYVLLLLFNGILPVHALVNGHHNP